MPIAIAARLACLLIVLWGPSRVDDKQGEAPRGEVFDRVVAVLRDGFHDQRIATTVVPRLGERYRERAHSAGSLNEERQVVQQMLAHIPVSHLGLLSTTAYERMQRSLAGEAQPTFGFELAQIEGDYFAINIWEGGPAELAGIKRGDRIARIDDDLPGRSPRLDWRSDDAGLPDPPMHALLCEAGDRITLRIERRPGEERDISVEAREYSALLAARASADVIQIQGRSIACVHFWFIHTQGLDALLEKLIATQFKDAEALVLDLRGRGGSATMVIEILNVLAGRRSKWRRPIVALIDNQTRSAKEMLAWELKRHELGVLVGQTTAGALLPATFASVGGDSVLMFPAFPLPQYTQAIEGKGVKPDAEVESPLVYSAGADPIRKAGLIKAAELAARRAAATQPVHATSDAR